MRVYFVDVDKAQSHTAYDDMWDGHAHKYIVAFKNHEAQKKFELLVKNLVEVEVTIEPRSIGKTWAINYRQHGDYNKKMSRSVRRRVCDLSWDHDYQELLWDLTDDHKVIWYFTQQSNVFDPMYKVIDYLFEAFETSSADIGITMYYI